MKVVNKEDCYEATQVDSKEQILELLEESGLEEFIADLEDGDEWMIYNLTEEDVFFIDNEDFEENFLIIED